MIPVVVGSNPIIHPSSIPEFRVDPVSGPLAQLVEQLTLNQLVEGSNPSRPTTNDRRPGNRAPVCFWALAIVNGAACAARPRNRKMVRFRTMEPAIRASLPQGSRGGDRQRPAVVRRRPAHAFHAGSIAKVAELVDALDLGSSG